MSALGGGLAPPCARSFRANFFISAPPLKGLRAKTFRRWMMCVFGQNIVFWTTKGTGQFAIFPAAMENKLAALHLLGAE